MENNVAPAQPDFAGICVLVADDSAAMRGIVRAVLSAFGVQSVVEAEDGHAAAEALKTHAVDLVICDWKMKPGDGLGFVKWLRDPAASPAPALPVIMLTAYSEPRRIAQAREAGATEFLAKPFTADALYRRIQTIMTPSRGFTRAEQFFGPDRRPTRDAFEGADRRAAR